MFVRRLLQWCVYLFLAHACTETLLFGEETESNSFILRADWFDRGNAVAGPDLYSCIINGRTTPNVVEYDIDFPIPGTYEIQVLWSCKKITFTIVRLSWFDEIVPFS